MRDFRESKSMAKSLREALAGKNLAISNSESLELIARVFALPNWNVLAAKIDSAERAHVITGKLEDVADAPRTQAISPFFVVGDVTRSIEFYTGKLGFFVGYKEPSQEPFFAIIYRDGAQIFLKSETNVPPLPNNRRHPNLRWDAYVYSPDPDALYAVFSGSGAPFTEQLRDTTDGLRGFEVTDPDGFVLFFGRPR